MATAGNPTSLCEKNDDGHTALPSFRMMMATLPFLHFSLEEENDDGHAALPSFLSRRRE